MAKLVHADAQTVHWLGPYTLVGRGPSATLRVHDRLVSSEHARLWYEDGRWWARDLASRNGTWIDGQRLGAGEQRALTLEQRLTFGGAPHTWIVADLCPPGAAARRLDTGALRVAEDGLLCLPDDEAPELTLFLDEQGAWTVERAGARAGLVEGEQVLAGGALWRVSLPAGVDPTLEAARAPRRLAELRLEFQVSRDEEHVVLCLLHGTVETALSPRAHSYLLLVLARRRLAEADQAPADQGWVYAEELARMLRIDNIGVNRHVFRARQQLAQAGVRDAIDLVERRPDTGQLRLGTAQIRVSILE